MTPIRIRWTAFRSNETLLFKVTSQGLKALPTLGGNDADIVGGCHALAKASSSGWVLEEDLGARALPNWSHARNIRNRIRSCVADGMLQEKPLKRPGWSDLVTLTEAGRKELRTVYLRKGRRTPVPTRPPRLDQSVHHLFVVLASLMILQEYGGRLIRLWGDEDLRSRSRRGASSTAGGHAGGLADGLLHFVDGKGVKRKVLIEVLDSKYTDEKILQKWRELVTSDALFFATSRKLADRCEGLGLPRPYVIG